MLVSTDLPGAKKRVKKPVGKDRYLMP